LSVYFIAQLKIHDRATYSKYETAFMGICKQFGGKLLSVDDAPEVLEGEWQPGRTVLLEFTSQERAHAWFHSPEYQSIAEYRRVASVANVALVRGRELPAS
jgi:uncharacterized protein (DUF1330 family)